MNACSGSAVSLWVKEGFWSPLFSPPQSPFLLVACYVRTRGLIFQSSLVKFSGIFPDVLFSGSDY